MHQLRRDDPGLEGEDRPITCPPVMAGVSPTAFASKDEPLLAMLEPYLGRPAPKFVGQARAIFLDPLIFADELRRRGVDLATAEKIAELYAANRTRPRPRLIVEDRAAPGRGRRWRTPHLNY